MILYKYCDLRGIDILKKCRLKVTPPGYLNDPMEWTWTSAESDEWDQWREKQRHQFFLESFNADLGLICLSEVPDSLVMWSYYAANHTGLVFGFDTSKFPEILRDALARVTYSREKVKWDSTSETADCLCLTKCVDWSHEKEWRAIVPLSRCTKQRVGIRRCSFYYLPIPVLSVVRVIMGARSPLRPLLRKLMWYGLKLENRVPFERAVLDSREYKLCFSNVIDPGLGSLCNT